MNFSDLSPICSSGTASHLCMTMAGWGTPPTNIKEFESETGCNFERVSL